MDRIWQWAWDRYKTRYSWAVYAVGLPMMLWTYLFWLYLIVAVQGSGRYVETAVLALIAAPVAWYVTVLPGAGLGRLVQRWAGGHDVDRVSALDATYAWARGTVVRAVAFNAVWTGLWSIVAAAVAGATWSQRVQYGVVGTLMGTAVMMSGVHGTAEAAARPARMAIVGGTPVGDDLPRSRPTFAFWSSAALLASSFLFAVDGTMLVAAFRWAREQPVLFAGIGCALVLAFGMPMTVGAALAPSLRPIRDLAEGTKRVAAGDYSRRLPVVQDDDLGALAASFNRMQAGLAERQRLQSAFGTYVDPILAARLLQQGDDVFSGERREVSVMFVDIRDFTPFAEANSAEDTVARLNALFHIVVPAVVDAGGHVNKFLGDGALAVFGAPNELADHADAAVNTAVLIHRRVAERFGGELRIGIGINTGKVIAGTIGGGGKLEFTLIGDAVNVAARVEQLTKTIGDAILLTHQTVNALRSRPIGLRDRGFHALKGKSAEVQVFGIGPTPADRFA
ncbi:MULTISPECIES: adenylate/guanylate cyclase domain-containing protein [Mycobacterium]|uniref:Adenylate/guanylate cyclase domain-containing protein n=1 Tax=Mycobacterium colombiense TaxID=339268 RepID=A0A329LEU5_9MYCO|nr:MULTISPECIES: adenylate/guanylate cyclase domain-containing protein [Mycobacterium]MDM4141663.1 adenylate/guanylate cyclase domain-containing protein [Mycobacterium sp. FLAC0960]RAV05756.1 adenylate/guanylate cyclase domain-containing protein [Mycobacterium colombiense]